MIVADASTLVGALEGDGPALDTLAEQDIQVPHVADQEVAQALRAHALRGWITPAEGEARLVLWRRLGLARHPAVGLLPRIWELRANLTAYDATYVALAEALGCPLATGDGRLARAPGIRCEVVHIAN